MTSNPPVITIDGPSGTGKGSISLLLAQEMGWHFLDSGALYRVLAYAASKHQIALDNEQGLALLATDLDVAFIRSATGKQTDTVFEGEAITDKIRTPACGLLASKISVFPAVRSALLERQREFRQLPGLVTDGRDMGTVVFPEANCKFYLDASPEERTRRRYNQLTEKGMPADRDGIHEAIVERDARDTSRSASPLIPADDAMVIDTTTLSLDEVFSKVLMHAKLSLGL